MNSIDTLNLDVVKTKKIADVKSLRTRNLLRGIIGENKPAAVMKALKKIKNTCSKSDYQLVAEIVRGHPLFQAVAVNKNFNRECPKIITDGICYSKDHIVSDINNHQERLVKLIRLFVNVANEVKHQNFSAAIAIMPEIIDKEGVSCFLIRILFFIRNHVKPRSQDSVMVEELLSKIKVDKAGYLVKLIKELSNPRTDYFAICKKVDKMNKETHLGMMSRGFVDHIPRSEIDFLSQLSAQYTFSLIDAFLYLSCVNRLGLPYTSEYFLISQALVREFSDLGKIIIDPSQYYGSEAGSVDSAFFRESFLLIELESIYNYKTIHGSLYKETENSREGRYPYERILLKNYFKEVKNLHDLAVTAGQAGVGLYEYSGNESCVLENSTALLYYIEKKDADLRGEESGFVKAMSFTRDIGVACPLHHLDRMRDGAESDEFKLVVACLRSIKDRGLIAEHGLRKSIQDVTIAKYESSIIKLLDYLYDISPSVTEHLILICDEMFLSKLFQLTEIPNQAISTRADMLEWYGEKTNDQTFKERAKNLRIDVQISKEKGTIDDSRIYVDPVKFTQWLNDNVLNNATILLDEIVTLNENARPNIKWDDVITGLSAHDQLASLLLNAYSEFCNNKYFGIASYLGRRIRHGTFKGTGMKEVKEIRSVAKYAPLFEDQDFKEHYDEWFAAYEQEFDRLAAEYLHIKSQVKPGGMIACDIKTVNKKVIANHMFKDIVESYVRNDNSLEVPYIVTEYCWRLAEEDLVVVRKHLMAIKSKWAVFRFDNKVSIRKKERYVQEFCQDLNAITAERFRTISSWFTKPSIASPTADLVLLFRAVVSEIKSFFPEFNPKLSYEKSDLTITGGAYFVIYDALYILIYNAARYGNPLGALGFGLTQHLEQEAKKITVCITSEMSSEGSATEVRDSIDAALSGDYENAHLVEGRSGIKKLKRMEYDRCIYDVRFQIQENLLLASFDFAVDY